MKIFIVDEHDNFLKFVEYQERQPTDIYRVAALWATNPNDQILLAQRKFTKHNDPGKWGPAVAGTIEEGETYETNIYKEAEEEVGLSGVPFKMGPKIFNDKGRFKFFVQWFLAEIDWPIGKFKIQRDEVEEIRWIDKASLKRDLDKSPSNYIAGAEKVWQEFL
ncbi:MAG TPA: NUDIX domain-containing protein [Candidatus Saccharimonadales bacterium]|nr:NUDIX domain-containing protein [Candidatus Saccharimonadales bacterium]